MTEQRLSNRQIATLKHLAVCCADGGQVTLTRDQREAMTPLWRRLTRPQESQAKEPEAGGGLCGAASHAVRVGEASADLPTTSEFMDVTAGETAPDLSTLPSGNRASMASRVESDESRDLFPTPPWATRALVERVLRHLGREGVCKWQKAWEPACGLGVQRAASRTNSRRSLRLVRRRHSGRYRRNSSP